MGVYSLRIDAGLVVLKLGLTASAPHLALDILASRAVLTGLVISKRKTRTLPCGLDKIENLVSIGIASHMLCANCQTAEGALLAPTAGW